MSTMNRPNRLTRSLFLLVASIGLAIAAVLYISRRDSLCNPYACNPCACGE